MEQKAESEYASDENLPAVQSSDEEEDGEFEIKPEDIPGSSASDEEMDSVTESIVVQIQQETKKAAKQSKSSQRRQAPEESSSEQEESEHPIIEFTAVSPPKPSKAQQRAS